MDHTLLNRYWGGVKFEEGVFNDTSVFIIYIYYSFWHVHLTSVKMK